nr:MAG TPA: portal protein [Caudoviricetes sp.]
MKIRSFFGQFFSGLWGGGLSDYSGLQESAPSITLNKEEPYIPPEAGMQLSAVWSCINLLSETMATLPLVIYEVKRNGDKIPARDTRLWQVLHNPNQIMTAHDFWLCMSMNRFLTGNAYALIHRDSTGALIGLTPLASASGQMEVAVLDGQVIYQYKKDGKYTYFTSDQILHWKGMGNGVVGLSTFDYMRATTNEMKNAQKNASALYGNGNQLTGIVTVDRVVKGQQLIELRNRFRELGAFNGDSWINFLPADMKYQQVAMSAADAQLLETRQFGVEEIGRWFGVPAALINSSSGTSGASIEQIVESFYRSTIHPLCCSVEQAIMQRVFTAAERAKYVAEFKMSALLRASVSSRYDSYSKALQNGFMTRNEVRKLENLPPVDGADQLTAQSNLWPVNQLGEQQASQSNTVPEDPVKQ